MLKDRLKSSAILISLISILIYLDGNYGFSGAEGLWLFPVLMFFALGTSHDAATMLLRSGQSVDRLITLVATSLITAMGYIPHLWPLMGDTYPANCPLGRLGWLVIGATGGMFLIIGKEMMRYGNAHEGTSAVADSETQPSEQTQRSEQGPPKIALSRIANGSFIALYVGLPLALLVALRSLGSGNWGLAALLTTIAVTKSTDAGAYFTGKAIGKHKLIPRLSPGKTWEGSIGGVLTAMLVAYACLTWLFPAVAGSSAPPASTPSVPLLASPLVGSIILGGLLAITGMLGDLAESLVKRECGAKDSGELLPGLGGIWDVTDSLIFASIPAFLCFASGVAGA